MASSQDCRLGRRGIGPHAVPSMTLSSASLPARRASLARAPLAAMLLLLVATVALSACKKDEGGGASPKSAKTANPAADKPAPTGRGVIQGTVRFSGTAPAPEPWGGANDSNCRSKHEPTIQLVRVKDGKLEDAFVYVKAGLPEGSHPVPTEAVVLDQKACEFTPRVFGVVAGQEIELWNSDAFMHNVKASGEFNDGLPGGVKRKRKLENEGVINIMCDVHPWMRSYGHVLSHPYFQVTKADGAFSIQGLVDGEYTVAVWHEKLGTQEKTVKVAAGQPATVDFELQAR